MSAGGTELELCLAVRGPAREELCAELERRRTIEGLVVSELERRELYDTYYDDEAGQLAAAHMALRLRRQSLAGSTRELLTWKGRSTSLGQSGVERAELEGEASLPWLARLFDAIRVGGVELNVEDSCEADAPHTWLIAAGLQAIQARSAQRTAAWLSPAGGVPVCELAIDRVSYTLGERRVVHRELELEAVADSGFAELEPLCAGLAREFAGQLRPWPWSKTALGRVLDRLEQRGELAALLEGELLSGRGYERVEALLRAT